MISEGSCDTHPHPYVFPEYENNETSTDFRFIDTDTFFLYTNIFFMSHKRKKVLNKKGLKSYEG